MNANINRPFVTTEKWAEFRQSLGDKTILKNTPDWTYLALINQKGFLKKFYCPYAPFIKTKGQFSEALEDCLKEAKQQKAFMIQIEPTGAVKQVDLVKAGFTKVKSFQPELTLLVDLSQDESELIKQMSATNRRIYRNYKSKGLSYEVSASLEDVDQVLELIEKVKQRNKANLHKITYLKKQAEILIANGSMKCHMVKIDGKTVAGCLAYDDQTTRYYAHVAADYLYHKLNPGAVLVAEMILDAKRSGLKWFDFCGITDSQDPNHPWYGFTKFKKSFGGQAKRFLGTWEKSLNPLLYAFYKVYKKLK